MAIRSRLTPAAYHSILMRGTIGIHKSTKKLLRQLQPGSIAVIWHDDLDALAAEGLVRAGVMAVVNAGQTMTGNVPATGCLLLLEAGIPVIEMEPVWFPVLLHQRELMITNKGLLLTDEGRQLIPVIWLDKLYWLEQYQAALHRLPDQLHHFIENTLAYAQTEKEWILQPLVCPDLKTELKNKHVLVVVRGCEYKQELLALSGYIRVSRPVLLAVDGGADALLEMGLTPDLIVGDMDSISDTALQCGAELVVHAYLDGHAPGMARVQQLGQKAILLPACGTSEDAAMLLAHDHGCERIVTVGAHTHMLDFLQKGRQGMGSTLLVRMKLGSKLIDAKGMAWLLNTMTISTDAEDDKKRVQRRGGWISSLLRLLQLGRSR